MGSNSQVIDGGEIYDKNGNYVGHKYTYGTTTVYVRLPKNSDGTIDGSIYYPGMNGYNQPREYGSFSEDISRAIIAVEKSESGEQGTNINAILEYLKTEEGLQINTNDYSGFSLGGGAVLANFKKHLKDDQNPQNSTLTLYDPYGGFPRNWPTKGQYYNDNGKNYQPKDFPDFMQRVKDTNSSIRTFAPTTRLRDFTNTQFYNTAARYEIPTVIITGDIGHNNLVNKTNSDGWIDYLNGKIGLEDINDSSNYQVTIPKKDANGNITWKTYSLEDIRRAKFNPKSCSEESLDGLLEALNYLESSRINIDFDYMAEIASLRSLVNTFSASIASPQIGFSSTSTLLNEENALISKIGSTINEVCACLDKEIGMIINATEEYQKLANQLEKNAGELNVVLNEIKNQSPQSEEL